MHTIVFVQVAKKHFEKKRKKKVESFEKLMHKIICIIFYVYPLFIDENHEFCEFLRYKWDRNGSRDHISILKYKANKVNSKTM